MSSTTEPTLAEAIEAQRRGGARGLDRTSAADAQGVLAKLEAPPEKLKQAAGALAELIKYANELSPLCWTVSLFKRIVRLNAGPVHTAVLQSHGLFLVLDSPSIDEDFRKDLSGRIHAEGRLASVPEGIEVLLFWDDLDTLLPRALEASKRFLDRATKKGKHRSAFPQSHSPGVLEALEQLLGETLPRRPAEKKPEKQGPDLDRLRQEFERFRKDPWATFTIRIRRLRAEQIREGFSKGAYRDLDRFNKEVWRAISSAIVDGEDVTGRFLGVKSPPTETIAEWTAALDRGAAEIHGNCHWGSATKVFAPMIKSSEEKTKTLLKAEEVLCASLNAGERYRALRKLKGFGENIASGLTMLFHPNEFAIFNSAAREALEHIGYAKIKDIDLFQELMKELQGEVEADDLMELDWFLYVLSNEGVDVLPRTGSECWLFQATPQAYHLAEELKKFNAGDEDTWTVSRHHKSLKPGHKVALWQAGSDAGVYAVGHLVSEPFELEGPDPFTGREKGTRIRFVYDRILETPVLKEKLQEHPELRDLQVLRAPQGTNFRVTTKEWAALEALIGKKPPAGGPYEVPLFPEIEAQIAATGLRIDTRTLRRYHLSLQTRRFVILSGVSGTGKTWLTRAYADAVNAHYHVEAVAPNWNTNEDLLGYFNPIDKAYHATAFTRFLESANEAYEIAAKAEVEPEPFHLVLDEMNLARVEYYFAKFLSGMEVVSREGTTTIDLGGGHQAVLPPNLYVIGTVNVDETTHGFADKVYDRAQLIELTVNEELLAEQLEGAPYASWLLDLWKATYEVAPFAFRVVDEIASYAEGATDLGVSWEEALDEQVLQKVLPKVKGTDPRLETALERIIELTGEQMPMSCGKAQRMLTHHRAHGFTSYF